MGPRLTLMVLVTCILVLEISMTALTFYTFWAPLTSGSGPHTLEPIPPKFTWLFVALAPITGLGEQYINSNEPVANQQK